ncbi:VanW family protein [Sporosarcina sp. HYO08]|uniref:VanW family protein n=1 Tax=Sporosarcina sp. HYO08 TaxID=1759557 RepID=UPI0007941F00|nr:VanW family protein [Sporosarcina sp. HYO08]KXH87309.1 hypothetical protein AU377_01675 [Sporosarcina sp. HYO08]
MRLKFYFPIVFLGLLTIFLYIQMVTPSTFVSAKDESDMGSIAGIQVDGVKKNDMLALLAEEVANWKKHDVIVQGETGAFEVPANFIHFDIQKTVDHYINLTEKPWYQLWGGKRQVRIPLEVTIDEEVNKLLDGAPFFYKEETIQAIREHAGALKSEVVQPKEIALSKDNMDRISFELQDTAENGTGIFQIAAALNETIITNEEKYSFLATLNETDSLYSADAANFVASTLYSAMLQTELIVVERHSQGKVPAYLEPGIEAKVDVRRGLDLAFENQTGRPYVIYADIKEGRLLIEVYSFKTDMTVSYLVSNKATVKPRTIYRLTPNLTAGHQKVEQEGKDGFRVQVYKVYSGGSLEKDELISRDFYPPIHRIVLVSSAEAPPATVTQDGTSTPTDGTSAGATKQPDEKNLDKSPSKEGADNKDSKDAVYDKGGNLIRTK